jgi:hypothetical protein
MGNKNSTRWKNHIKKGTVEECRRVNGREAAHIGINTTTTPVANSAARRLWCLCPACGARAWYLYQAPEAQQWKCRSCHNLAYKSAQQRGTWAAFYDWLNQERWREYADRHPSKAWLYEEVHAAYQKTCLPFDLREMEQARRLELLAELGNEEAIKRRFELQRMEWSGLISELETQAARWTMADLKVLWKRNNRSKPKTRSSRHGLGRASDEDPTSKS